MARPAAALEHDTATGAFAAVEHENNLRLVAADPERYPNPNEILHAVVIAAYNESYDVIQPTLESVKNTSTNNDQIIIFLPTKSVAERGLRRLQSDCSKNIKAYLRTFRLFNTLRIFQTK